MGEHESQVRRARARGAALPPGGRSSTSAKPDFRATVGRRLSEERELGPQVLNLISAETPSEVLPSAPGTEPSPADRPVSRVDQRDEFIAELAQSMQAAMSSAHERVVQDLERRRMARVDAIRGRATEADRGARDRTEQEIARIDRWVEVETQRIRLEGDVGIAARRRELETRLAHSRTEVDRAVEVLGAAVSHHRSTVDAFLVRIAAEPDPATIARLVDDLPPVPSLDQIGEVADAVDGPPGETGEDRLVGVMADRPTSTGG